MQNLASLTGINDHDSYPGIITSMNLRDWTSEQRAALFAALERGDDPPFGEYDLNLLKEAKRADRPQMGTTTYSPDAVSFEFIFHGSIVFEVRVETPQRIVFLPVPEWVVESIWQGEISGSFHFESDVMLLLEKFERSTSPEENKALFNQRPKPTRG